ncbi:TolC family protein [Pseudomonas fluorescens]|uniref:TolC family protein n=1 Tax=Pseudomonas fluorescens TaxID=294 RepID=UPI0020350B52|nr:TolC family protein [Pseudomonas fluorescens]
MSGIELPELQDVPDTPLPTLAAGLPIEILGNRPDVHAAELRVRSALALADATRLGFYPTLALTSSVGTTSSSLSSFMTHPVGSLSATLALPFLEFNTARLASQSARINAETALVAFRKTLYAALQDVENNLSARQQLTEQNAFLREALALARESERLAKVRWLAGSTDIQPWLDAQQSSRFTELNLLQNVLARRTNAVQLYVALGGHYRGAYKTGKNRTY